MEAARNTFVRHARMSLQRPHSKSACHQKLRNSSTSTSVRLERSPTAMGQVCATAARKQRTLALLPTSDVLRSYAIMAVSSSPLLFKSLSWVVQGMLRSRLAILDPDRNPVLHWILRQTFYDQFCAGENPQQVKQTVRHLQSIGYDGAILEYGAELVDGQRSAVSDQQALRAWHTGLLQSVEVANRGDFVGLKWSGMGQNALELMIQGREPSIQMSEAMEDVCKAAASKGVKLLPAAEPQSAQASVDRWTLIMAEKFNKVASGDALLYNTYQTYLKSMPGTLSQHLTDAKNKGFVLGIKLVRGAYLWSEPRHYIWDTKAETDEAYDGVACELLQRRPQKWLRDSDGALRVLPHYNMVLATHNMASAERARQLRDAQTLSEREAVPMVYAQLHGMADEVSCKLLQAQRDAQGTSLEAPRVFKASTWGTTKQCLNYLLRRAAENQDAISRTRDTRRAMGSELRQRVSDVFRRRA